MKRYAAVLAAFLILTACEAESPGTDALSEPSAPAVTTAAEAAASTTSAAAKPKPLVATVPPSPRPSPRPATSSARPKPPAPKPPAPQPVAPKPAANCHASYPDFCIPPAPPDLDCPDIPAKNFTVVGSDPHGFDGDHDGLGCER